MPSAIRVPFPNTVAVDPHFRIDIRDPTTGAVGLQVGQIADREAFERTCRPHVGQSRRDVLLNPQLWATFAHAKLSLLAEHIDGLNVERRDLTPPGGFPQALHAFIPSGPRYHDLPAGVTTRILYKDLHGVLADVIACQAVWYMRVLRGRPEEFEMRSTRPGIDGQIWHLWKFACPNLNHLDALYIVSIRRTRVANANTWAYFPEIEIRSQF